jgi:leucyl/phenylalanyl-tRNA--protein transferase
MSYFPHPLMADEDGLLAVGGDLTTERLRLAYRFGIFPWYNDGPVLWWFTHPRCILRPQSIKVSKSMRAAIRKGRQDWTIRLNNKFDEVISACGQIKRDQQAGSWITREIKGAYVELHRLGHAHSIEVYEGDNLVGGLYGVVNGKIFVGESMFAKKPNSSKYALILLCQYISAKGCLFIDCQQDTPHLRSMGAEVISKMDFWNALKANLSHADMALSTQDFENWYLDQAQAGR